MELNKAYFYTATINEWKPLLKDNSFKDIIIDSLKYLTDKRLVRIYAFIIMPNHIHFIWVMLRMNGKEMPNESFMKFTSHQFLKKLQNERPDLLILYEVNLKTRKHFFWQRDSLAIELFSEKAFEQKMEYVHNNPVQKKWLLAEEPVGYKYSSAKFYESEIDDFGIMTHYSEWQ